MPPEKVLGESGYETVRLAELSTEGRFNRPVSDAAVEKILSDFNAKAFGALILWERAPRDFVIIDGQHRVEAARRRGIREDAKCLPAVVYRGITLSQAAELFVQHNATKMVSAYDKFRALLTAGDLESMEIDRIVRAHDLIVASHHGDGTVSCVDAIRKVYVMGEPPGAILGCTLATLQSAWGPASEAYTSAIVRGIGLYFHEHRDGDPRVLADALARGPGAPINFIAWAKTIAGTQRLALDKAIAQVIETRVLKRRSRPKAAAS